MSEIVEWDISEILHSKKPSDQRKFAIILLNQPVLNEASFVALWTDAKIRHIVDGGGNRWNDVRNNFPCILYPHIVSGDLDSIQQNVLEEFKQRKDIRVVETPDQDETDFTKAIRILQEDLKSDAANQVTKVVAYCESSGRFDQIMANVETLFHATTILPNHPLILMGSRSISWLLPPGQHRIQIGNLTVQYCSLIPVGSPCSSITTTGLKWNLAKDKLAFGYLVSTSNKIAQDNVERVVTVHNSDPILWSMETIQQFPGFACDND